MPQTNEYVITIKIDGDVQDELAAGALPETGGESTPAQTTSDSTDVSVKKIMKQLFGYAAIKSTVDQVAGYQHSIIALNTGKNETQERATFGYNVASKIANTGAAVAMGIMTGNLPLVAIGLAVSAVNTAVSYAQKANTLRIEEGNETVSRNIRAQRATVSGSRYMSAADM